MPVYYAGRCYVVDPLYGEFDEELAGAAVRMALAIRCDSVRVLSSGFRVRLA